MVRFYFISQVQDQWLERLVFGAASHVRICFGALEGLYFFKTWPEYPWHSRRCIPLHRFRPRFRRNPET